MNVPALRKLTRSALQDLAKEYGVKGNLPSETMIREILQVAKVNTEPPLDEVLKDYASPLASPKAKAPLLPDDYIPVIRGRSVESNDSHGSDRKDTPPPSPGPQDASLYQIHTAIHTFSAIAQQDRAFSGNLDSLETVMGNMQSRADDLADVLQAERARRLRIETYLRLWEAVPARWSSEALDPGKQQFAETEDGQRYELSEDDDEELDVKRGREEDENEENEDVFRYNPRLRTNSGSESPISQCSDKGKNKMTAKEVAAHEQETQGTSAAPSSTQLEDTNIFLALADILPAIAAASSPVDPGSTALVAAPARKRLTRQSTSLF